MQGFGESETLRYTLNSVRQDPLYKDPQQRIPNLRQPLQKSSQALIRAKALSLPTSPKTLQTFNLFSNPEQQANAKRTLSRTPCGGCLARKGLP